MDFIGLMLAGVIFLFLALVVIAGLAYVSTLGLQTIIGWLLVSIGVGAGTWVLVRW